MPGQGLNHFPTATEFAGVDVSQAVVDGRTMTEVVSDVGGADSPSPTPLVGDVAQGRPLLQTDDGVIVAMQRPDGSMTLGPIPTSDWHVEARGSSGSRHIWAWAEGISEFQVSTAHDGADNFMPKLEGMRLSWRSDSALKTAILAAGMVGLSGSATEIRGLHVLGQSTSNGNASISATTTTAPSATRLFMPMAGVRALGNEQLAIRRIEALRDEILLDFLPALERVHLTSGETGWVKAGARVVTLSAASKAFIVATLGIGSVPYEDVALTKVPFSNLMKLIRRERIAALVKGLTYVHPTMWHPWHEGSVNLSVAQIVTQLTTAQTNYTTEINKITGAVGEVWMLTDGLASSGHYNAVGGAPNTTPVVPWAVLQAAVANPTKIIAVCPRYFLTHLADDVHPDAAGCLRRGEYFGRADFRAVNGDNVLPLYMTSAVRVGAVITVTFNVWSGHTPVRFNTAIVTNPGNHGVEYIDVGGNAAVISSVATGPATNQIQVTLDMTPTGTSPVIRIASQQIDDTGPTGGPRSTISDTAPDTFDNYAWPQEIVVTT